MRANMFYDYHATSINMFYTSEEMANRHSIIREYLAKWRFERFDELYGVKETTMNSDKVKKLYCVESDEVQEFNVIYENDQYYYALREGYSRCTEIKKADIVHDDGCFEKIYINDLFTCYSFREKRFFVSKSLVTKYAESCKKYGEIWRLRRDIDLLKKDVENYYKYIDDANKEIKKKESMILEILKKLDE